MANKRDNDSAEIDALIAAEGQKETGTISRTDQILMRLIGAVDRLTENRPQASDNDAIKVLSAGLERFAEAQEEMVRETKRGVRPSNERSPMVSAFNPRGDAEYPRPVLACRMLLPWEAEADSLTREEIELLNLLAAVKDGRPLCAGDYLLKRVDNTKVRVTVRIEMDVDAKRPTKLIVHHDTAFNNDNFRQMPPLADWLRFILRQTDDPEIRKKAAEVITIEEEEFAVERGELAISR